MNTDHLLDDVREVNLSYLLLMQRLINTDREMAMFRLKIDEDMADLLGRIPVPDLARLARCNQLLCHFSLTDSSELYALISAARDDSMRQTHAAILLAGQDKREGDRRQGERRSGERRANNGEAPGKRERRSGDRRAADRRQGSRRHQDTRAEGNNDGQ